MTQNTNKT